ELPANLELAQAVLDLADLGDERVTLGLEPGLSLGEGSLLRVEHFDLSLEHVALRLRGRHTGPHILQRGRDVVAFTFVGLERAAKRLDLGPVCRRLLRDAAALVLGVEPGPLLFAEDALGDLELLLPRIEGGPRLAKRHVGAGDLAAETRETRGTALRRRALLLELGL